MEKQSGMVLAIARDWMHNAIWAIFQQMIKNNAVTQRRFPRRPASSCEQSKSLVNQVTSNYIAGGFGLNKEPEIPVKVNQKSYKKRKRVGNVAPMNQELGIKFIDDSETSLINAGLKAYI